MKIANWNIEWMNRWFTNDSAIPALKSPQDARQVGINDLPGLMRRVGQVIQNMDADIRVRLYNGTEFSIGMS